jgi:nucleosome binding factor SPN SPT16 subunit
MSSAAVTTYEEELECIRQATLLKNRKNNIMHIFKSLRRNVAQTMDMDVYIMNTVQLLYLALVDPKWTKVLSDLSCAVFNCDKKGSACTANIVFPCLPSGSIDRKMDYEDILAVLHGSSSPQAGSGDKEDEVGEETETESHDDEEETESHEDDEETEEEDEDDEADSYEEEDDELA